MDDGMVLDALLVMIAVLCLPIGFGRGIIRETFVSTGILLGAMLGNSWARPWGSDVASALEIATGTGQFLTSAAFVVLAASIVGYGGPAAARVSYPRRWAKLAGALLAVCNGILILGVLVRDFGRFHPEGNAVRRLTESEIASVFLTDFGWLLLGASGIALVLVLLGLLFRERTASIGPIAPEDPAGAAIVPGEREARRPRLRWGRDDGKVEPVERGFDPATGRFSSDAPHIGQTIPVAAVGTTSWSLDRAEGQPRGYDEWLNVTRPVGQERADTKTTGPQDSGSRCESCGERLAPHEAFCPRCGRARS